jgi:hypothetical protein
MKKKTILVVLIWLIFLIHCSDRKPPEAEETVLEEKSGFIDLQWRKEKSIDASDYDHANLYLDDYDDTVNTYGYSLRQTNQKIIKKYDKDLNLKSEKEFQMGQGPGDLGGGAHFFSCGDYIYVPDNTQARINIFDRKMNFIKFIKAPLFFLSPIFTKDGKHFVANRYVYGENRTSIYDIHIVSFPELKNKKIHSFGPCRLIDEKGMILRGDCPGFCYFIKNEKIYLLNMKTYQIMMFDLSGKMLKRIRVHVEEIPIPEKMKKVWIKDQTHPKLLNRSKFVGPVQPASWAIPMGKGFVVIRRTGYSAACEGLVDGDYFDYDLQLLGKVKFPCFHLIYMISESNLFRVFAYDNGYVYLITQDLQETDEDINLEKWQVRE